MEKARYENGVYPIPFLGDAGGVIRTEHPRRPAVNGASVHRKPQNIVA
ncbi:MAG: hypothetical protein ABSG01_10015 [Anaerolineales bacterium]